MFRPNATGKEMSLRFIPYPAVKRLIFLWSIISFIVHFGRMKNLNSVMVSIVYSNDYIIVIITFILIVILIFLICLVFSPMDRSVLTSSA